jgi:nitrous oxidase accessory protein
LGKGIVGKMRNDKCENRNGNNKAIDCHPEALEGRPYSIRSWIRVPHHDNFFKFAITLTFLSALNLNANTLTVCETCNYKTIQSAITAANTNDTVEVNKGIYKESPILITKSIKLKGIESPTLDGENKEHVVDIVSDNVIVDGFTIINSGVSDIREFAGIHVENAKGCELRNNTLENNTYGFYFAKVTDCILENNSSIGNAKDEISGGNGIHLWSSNHFKIRKNKISKHRDGIYFEFSTELLIEENESFNSIRYGMHFMFASNNKFFKNHFYDNSTGVAVMFSKNIQVKDNLFERSRYGSSYGLLVKDITDSEFINNTIQDNTIGITADNATRNKFIANQILRNGWAFNIMGNCELNEVRENNFIGNVFDLSTNTRENLNTYEKNFWDAYKGFDLDRDGTGDKPYLPVRFFSYWVNIYPFLMVLFQSPIIEFLEIAERAFPVMTPVELKDKYPQMKKFAL